MTTSKKKPGPTRLPKTAAAAAAFASIEPELARLQPGDIGQVNTDIPSCVAIALGALPGLREVRGEIVEQLPHFPIASLDRLETYALGAWYAHLSSIPAERSEPVMKKLLAEAAPLRETLLVAAEALAHKGLFDAARVAEIRSGAGHVDTANDLVALGTLFAGEWAAVMNKTAVEEEEVRRAEVLGPELLVALGEREVAGLKKPSASSAKDTRARAFTLLARAYDECRRAVSYLRWHEDDADLIAPSLFKRREKPTKTVGDGPPPPNGPGSVTPPSPAPAAG